ncbi:hypothetical protein Q3E52_12430, partial [Enterococcus faecium]|nr:hypothetical protein [Enterococcus faecium]
LWLKTLYRKRAVTWPFIFYTIIWTLSVIQNLIFTILLMHGKFGSFLFSFYSKIILFLTLNRKDLFLNKKYSFFTIIKKKIKLDELKYCLILEARGEE